MGAQKKLAVLCFMYWVGSSPVVGSLELRILPMFVNYLLNCSTISFLSVQPVPSEVINLSFTICFLFFDFNTSFIVFHVFLQSFLYNSNLHAVVDITK